MIPRVDKFAYIAVTCVNGNTVLYGLDTHGQVWYKRPQGWEEVSNEIFIKEEEASDVDHHQ